MRLVRAVLGGELDRRVRPVVAVSFTYSASFSTFWVYVGIYAVKGLHWPVNRVGLLFLLSAPAAAIANYLSGHVSDRTGRKGLIVASFLLSAVNVTALALLGHRTAIAFVLIVVQGVIGAPAYSLDRVLVADLVPDGEDREHAYATVRVATNLGALAGPPFAGLLIYLGGWTTFLFALAVLGLLGALLTIALLPPTGGSVVTGEPGAGSLRLVLRDRPFVFLLVSTLLAFTDYCGFETVLPVVAVSTYGIASSTWGLLVVISPVLVILFQLRVARASLRLPSAQRLATAILLMGLPFLALVVSGEIAVIAAVIVVFVLGEMIWMPTSQALAAEIAPTHARGTYFGALAATTGPAWTLAPFIAFQFRTHGGVASVWLFFAAIAFAGAIAGAAAARVALRRQAS